MSPEIRSRAFALWMFFALATANQAQLPPATDRPVNFATDVQPILLAETRLPALSYLTLPGAGLAKFRLTATAKAPPVRLQGRRIPRLTLTWDLDDRELIASAVPLPAPLWTPGAQINLTNSFSFVRGLSVTNNVFFRAHAE